MVVQHNLTAMNANRMLGLTQSTQAKSTEKLSSGYKINRAADDAAGLSISEKMRKQIRGLTQASLNAEDGISAVQTAEGALNEVQDMLQRMNELAVKASNGTMSEDDRNYIQDEIDQLVTEIDRVAETTKFNETYLLKGVDGTKTVVSEATVSVAYAGTITGESELAWAGDNAATVYATLDGESNELTENNFDQYFVIDESGAAKVKDGVQFYAEAPEDTDEYGDQLSPATINVANYVKVQSDYLLDQHGAVVSADDIASHFNEDGSYKGTLYKLTTDGNGTLTQIGAEQIDNYVVVTRTEETSDEVDVKNALNFKLHVGADCTDNNQISVDIKAMDATSLGLREDTARDGVGKTLLVNGANDENARDAITVIAKAIQDVSTQRSALGAVQNRLEHTIANLDNVVENTTAAEAQIRDTDMATEMVKYSNNNILAQAGQAMLAQANQANQGVLSLLG